MKISVIWCAKEIFEFELGIALVFYDIELYFFVANKLKLL